MEVLEHAFGETGCGEYFGYVFDDGGGLWRWFEDDGVAR
jgi:hypothetical protein